MSYMAVADLEARDEWPDPYAGMEMLNEALTDTPYRFVQVPGGDFELQLDDA